MASFFPSALFPVLLGALAAAGTGCSQAALPSHGAKTADAPVAPDADKAKAPVATSGSGEEDEVTVTEAVPIALFVALGSAKTLDFAGGKVADQSIATFYGNTVVGKALGTTTLVRDGKAITVTVFDAKSPPPAVAPDPADPVAVAALSTIAHFQTQTSYFGDRYSDVFYVPSYTPVGTDAGGNPVAAASVDGSGMAITYYYDNSSVLFWTQNTAPCADVVRIASCSNAANGQRHFLTVNAFGTTGNNSWCYTGSPVADALTAQGAPSTDAPGILGDICTAKADGSCPARMLPLYAAINTKNAKSAPGEPIGTTVLSYSLPSLQSNGELVLTAAGQIGCGPDGR